MVPSNADLSRFDSDVIATTTRLGLWWRITNVRYHEILMVWSDGIKMRSMYTRNDPYKAKRIRGRNKQTSPDTHSKTDSQASRALLLRRNVSTVTSWRDPKAASAYLYGGMARYVISGNQTPNLRAITFKDHPTMDSFVVNGASTTGYSSFWSGDNLHVLHAHRGVESRESLITLYDNAARRYGSGVWMYFPVATAHGERLTDVFGRRGSNMYVTRRVCFRSSLGRHWLIGPIQVPNKLDIERQGSLTFPYRPENNTSLDDQIQINPSHGSTSVDETRAINATSYSHIFSLHVDGSNEPLRIYYDSSSDGGSKMIVHGPSQENDQKLPSFRFPPPRTALDKSLKYAKYMLSTVSLEGVASVTPSYKMVHYCDPRNLRLCGFLFQYTDPTRPAGVLGEYRLDRVGPPISVVNPASDETVDALYFAFKVPPKGSSVRAVLEAFSTERLVSKDDIHVYRLPLRGKVSAWFSHKQFYIESPNLKKTVIREDYTGSDKEMVITV